MRFYKRIFNIHTHGHTHVWRIFLLYPHRCLLEDIIAELHGSNERFAGSENALVSHSFRLSRMACAMLHQKDISQEKLEKV